MAKEETLMEEELPLGPEVTDEDEEEWERRRREEEERRLAPYKAAAAMRKESAAIVAEHDTLLSDILFEITLNELGA